MTSDSPETNGNCGLGQDLCAGEEGSRSSSPGLDWLFSHSDSDSEFADVAREGQQRHHRRTSQQSDDDSWNVIRSSPESPIEPCASGAPCGSVCQGAIPKKRRQGNAVAEEETAAATMEDLVLRLLDIVNNSLHDQQCKLDIQKLNVLKQRLVQEGGIAEPPRGCPTGSATPDTPTANIGNSDRPADTPLCRKPAVRRRRHVAGTAPSPASPPTDTPDLSSLFTSTSVTSLTTTTSPSTTNTLPTPYQTSRSHHTQVRFINVI